MKTKRLALSIVKTSFILFHSKKLKPYKTFKLKINGVNIQQVSAVKYLGVTFDANLTWKNRIDELCLKLSKTVGVISKLRYYVNIDVLKILYNSLIYPFFTYGVHIWGLTYPTYLNPLTTLQKCLVRIMTFSEPLSNSEPLLRSLNLLKFCDIIHVEILSFVYQWFHKLTPSCFADSFKQISSVHPYYTCQSNNENLFVNRVQTTQYGLRSLCFSAAKLWNSLPLDVKQVTPFSTFRQYIKNSMIDRYNKDTDNQLS